MDSGNSGSMSSSGDEEYDSVPGSFLNPHAQIGCFTASQLASPSSHHPYAFDVSPTNNYVHLNNLLNLEAAPPPPPRSDHQSPNCTVPAVSLKSPRNPKKRSRASRRAPTTVMTTDTTNFRAMVQEFTGIPAPPFSSSSYSRRLDLLAASSSLRSSSSSPYPLRPSPHKLSSINPSTLLSSSPSTLLSNHHNMGDATTTTTTTNANNNSSPSILNYQLIPNTHHDHLGTGAFNHPQHMSMQLLPFQTPNHISLQYPFPNSLPPSPFTPKSHSHPTLSNIPSLEDQLGLGMSRHPQPHLHLLTSHTLPHLSTNSHSDHHPTPQHHNLGSNGPQPDPSHHHPFTSFPPTTCKLINFSASSSSSTFNLDDNNSSNNNMDNSSATGQVGR